MIYQRGSISNLHLGREHLDILFICSKEVPLHTTNGKILEIQNGGGEICYPISKKWVSSQCCAVVESDAFIYFQSVSYTPPNNSLRGLKVPTPIDPALAETFFHRRQIAINSNTTIIVPNITLAPVATVTATSTASPTPTFATFGTGPISLSLPPFAQVRILSGTFLLVKSD